MKRRAFFLDRDGVVIEQIHYLADPAQVALIPGVAAAIRAIREHGDLAVVITNQSGVGRGYFTMAAVDAVHRRMVELLRAEGAELDDIRICPHAPEENCSCRKPLPGLFLAAAQALDIDLGRSVMVGDRRSDLDSGVNAGCAASILVRTGYGAGEEEKCRAAGFPVVDDLPAAVRLIYRTE